MKKRFNMRAFTTFMMAWSFVFLFISGIVLFIAPSGRVANWSQWTFLGLDKDAWETVHVIWAIVFTIATVFHLKYNWAIFKSYFVNWAKEVKSVRLREVGVATILSIAIFIGAAVSFAPFAYIMNTSEYFKDVWEEKSPILQLEPDKMTLSELAEHFGVSETAINNYLKGQLGLEPMNATETLEDYKHRMEDEGYITDEEKMGTWDIYYALRDHFQSAESEGSEGTSVIKGQGYGRYTVSELAEKEGIDVDKAVENLQNYVGGTIDIDKDTRIRDIMDATGLDAESIISIMKTGKTE
jgi:DNA-binding transcriptional ArsR family regulator